MKYDLTVWQYQKGWPVNTKKRKIANITKKITSIKETDLNDIKWVWEETIKILIEGGIYSKDDLLKTSEETINSLGIGFFGKRWILNFLKNN